MGLRFIFMLTRNDRTVEDAEKHLETALGLGVRHIGFKDVGLPIGRLRSLNRTIKAGGATSYLEVVSLDPSREVASARAAVDIGVDILLGGTRVDDVLPVIEGTGIRYFPFPGRIVGHPSVLEGTVDEIVASAVSLTARDGVDGLDLLAYRFAGDVPQLMRAVCAAVDKPVIMAGSIASAGRIEAARNAGAAGFTIGTAALDGEYRAKGPDLTAQLEAIIRDVAKLNNHLSTVHKRTLNGPPDSADAAGEPCTASRLDGPGIRLATISGEEKWRFHARADQLFFVHKGRMAMRLRDREEILSEGEFIVVPRGVDHCPAALGGPCEVVLIDPPADAGVNAPKDHAA